MMVRGECYRLPPWARDTGATVFGEHSGDRIEYLTPCENGLEGGANGMTPEERREEYPVRVTMRTRKRITEASAWPTPTANGNGNRTEYGGKSGDGLATAVKRAGAESATGPTPQANDSKHGWNENRKGHQIMLIHAIRDRAAAKSATGPTPCATDGKGSGKTGTFRDRLDYAVERGETKTHSYPTVGTRNMGGCSGSFNHLKKLVEVGRIPPEDARGMAGGMKAEDGTEIQNVGMLNPDWVEWLMGWPIMWTDIDYKGTGEGEVLPWLDLSDDPADWNPPPMQRITTRRKNRVKRIETLGNGQVPLCAVVAFIFGHEIMRVALMTIKRKDER